MGAACAPLICPKNVFPNCRPTSQPHLQKNPARHGKLWKVSYLCKVAKLLICVGPSQSVDAFKHHITI